MKRERAARTSLPTGPLTAVVVAFTLAGAVVLPAVGQSSPDPSTGPAATPARLDVSALSGAIVFDHEGQVWVMAADGTGRSPHATVARRAVPGVVT